MLVQVARGGDYKKGSQFIVYAVEETSFRISYAVYPVGELSRPDLEVDPVYVQAGIFDVVADRVTQEWAFGERKVGDETLKFKSFPEFFSIDGFWYRLNDRGLDGQDYDVIRSYKKKYEDLYADLITKTQ